MDIRRLNPSRRPARERSVVARAVSRALPPLALLAGLSSVLLHPAAAQAGDRILFNDGHELRGRISAQRLDGVVVSLSGGASTRVSWARVAGIEYDAPSRFTQAVAHADAGLVDEALADFVALLSDDSLRRPIRQEVLFRLAELSRRRGQRANAIEAYQDLITDFPSGRYLVEAVRGLAECHLMNGELDSAERAIGRVAGAAPGDARLDSELGFLRARISETRELFAEARSAYERAERDEYLEPARRHEAALGLARCLHREGREPEAASRYRTLVDADASPLVLAGAWNGLGDLALAEGRDDRDADRLAEALFAYLRGVVLYLPGEGEPEQEHRRSVAGAAQCFEYLSQLESDPQLKARHLLRARLLRDSLDDR